MIEEMHQSLVLLAVESWESPGGSLNGKFRCFPVRLVPQVGSYSQFRTTKLSRLLNILKVAAFICPEVDIFRIFPVLILLQFQRRSI